MTETSVVLVIVLLASVAYGAFLFAFIRGDGIRFGRRPPPLSRYPDIFDPATGPRQLA